MTETAKDRDDCQNRKRRAPSRNTGICRRSAARLAAVQALYEMDLAGADADAVLDGFKADRWRSAIGNDPGPDAATSGAPDPATLEEIVTGAARRLGEIDALIAGALDQKWPLDRLEVLLRAALRAGTYELLAAPAVPPKVVITEYVKVASAFFGTGEMGLVNGILDRIAHDVRAAEMEAATVGPEAQAR
jgi:N utilization substance protein B